MSAQPVFLFVFVLFSTLNRINQPGSTERQNNNNNNSGQKRQSRRQHHSNVKRATSTRSTRKSRGHSQSGDSGNGPQGVGGSKGGGGRGGRGRSSRGRSSRGRGSSGRGSTGGGGYTYTFREINSGNKTERIVTNMETGVSVTVPAFIVNDIQFNSWLGMVETLSGGFVFKFFVFFIFSC